MGPPKAGLKIVCWRDYLAINMVKRKKYKTGRETRFFQDSVIASVLGEMQPDRNCDLREKNAGTAKTLAWQGESWWSKYWPFSHPTLWFSAWASLEWISARCQQARNLRDLAYGGHHPGCRARKRKVGGGCDGANMITCMICELVSFQIKKKKNPSSSL